MTSLALRARRLLRDRRGFTLIELLVVIIILGLLAGLVGPRLFGKVDASKVKTAETQIKMLRGALETYRLDMGRFPTEQEGLAILLSCLRCHEQATTIAALQATRQDCFSCHGQDDAHNGTLGPNCATCHTPEGWSPSTFDHNRSDFKLTGAHTSTACEQCHVNGVFKGTPKDCFSCHQQIDPHMGQFGTVCESCHSTEAWKPAFFDHDTTGFQLIGSHKNVDCKACHINGIFADTPKDCFSCHAAQDAHMGQFGRNCDTCHQPTQWSAAEFDHNSTAFPLTGRHVSAACLTCHTNGLFKGTPKDCFACHA